MKKRAGLLGLLALLSGCLFSAAQETAGSKAAKAPCPADTVSFSRDVLPVLRGSLRRSDPTIRSSGPA